MVDYVGENLQSFEGAIIPGPYAVFLSYPESPETSEPGRIRLLHGTITSAYFAIKQAKADQVNWGLPCTKVQISECVRHIYELELAYFRALNKAGCSTYKW